MSNSFNLLGPLCLLQPPLDLIITHFPRVIQDAGEGFRNSSKQKFPPGALDGERLGVEQREVIFLSQAPRSLGPGPRGATRLFLILPFSQFLCGLRSWLSQSQTYGLYPALFFPGLPSVQ